MKTVFTSREIAHIWASRSADFGRSAGNASFDGDAFKSYATVIGRRITFKGKTAYVLDRASFSNSTSKVQGRIAQAVHHEKVFNIREGQRGQSLDFNPQTLRDWFLARAKEMGEKMPSRYARIRAGEYSAITATVLEALDVCEFWGLPHAKVDAMLAARVAGQELAAETLKLAREKMIAAQAKKEARIAKERRAREIASAEKFLAEPDSRQKGFISPQNESALALLPEGLRVQLLSAIDSHNSGLVARWQAGEGVSMPYGAPVRLRAMGGEMETSQGARVPLADAERTFRFVIALRAKGWHRNGQTHSVGGYQLDAVNEFGVVAGCHRVAWDEIERFAVSQGWANS